MPDLIDRVSCRTVMRIILDNRKSALNGLKKDIDLLE